MCGLARTNTVMLSLPAARNVRNTRAMNLLSALTLESVLSPGHCEITERQCQGWWVQSKDAGLKAT
jgi:hypothetical protein